MQLTIRGLPQEIEKAVRKEARKERISLNKAVIRLLEKAIGRSSAPGEQLEHDDLDRFCGAWSSEEAAEMEKTLSWIRTVDEELWK